MPARIREAAQKVADNPYVTAIGRVCMVGLMGMTPVQLNKQQDVAQTVNVLSQRVAVIEQSRVDARAEISRRFDEVARQNQRSIQDDADIRQQLSVLAQGQARAEATTALILRALGRVESTLDGRR